MGQNIIKSSFFAQRAKKASAKGRSPLQELEEGSRSGSHLLVNMKDKVRNICVSADTVLKVPYTPGAVLASTIRKVVEEEGSRLGLKVKVQEGAGVPLRRSLVAQDLRIGSPAPRGTAPYA